MVDPTAFAPGRNLATTPGKVVYRNRLIELIQYTPQTEQTYAVPLLFIPPWINKYYILDMQPKNSLRALSGRAGLLGVHDQLEEPRCLHGGAHFRGLYARRPAGRQRRGAGDHRRPFGEPGRLLHRRHAAGDDPRLFGGKGERRFGAATFMVSLQDYAQVGETAIFMGEPAIDFVEQQMMERGYLDSREMANMFSLLRSNDLIWANVVNNYLLGNPPPAFDLLYWNSDGTRMARAAHSWYLRNTYVENNLIKAGQIVLMDEPIDLGRISQDIYAVGAESDHIVPWYAAWRITQLRVGGSAS